MLSMPGGLIRCASLISRENMMPHQPRVKENLSRLQGRGGRSSGPFSHYYWERLTVPKPKISARWRRKAWITAKTGRRRVRLFVAGRNSGRAVTHCNMHATGGRASRPFHRLPPLSSSHAFHPIITRWPGWVKAVTSPSCLEPCVTIEILRGRRYGSCSATVTMTRSQQRFL